MSGNDPIVAPRRFMAQRVSCGRFALLLLLVFFLTSSCISAPPKEKSSPKNVLVLSSFTERIDFIELEPLKSSLRSHLTVPVNFSVEYLDSVRFEDARLSKEPKRNASPATRMRSSILWSSKPIRRFASF